MAAARRKSQPASPRTKLEGRSMVCHYPTPLALLVASSKRAHSAHTHALAAIHGARARTRNIAVSQAPLRRGQCNPAYYVPCTVPAQLMRVHSNCTCCLVSFLLSRRTARASCQAALFSVEALKAPSRPCLPPEASGTRAGLSAQLLKR